MKDFFEMSSTCIQGGYPRAMGGYQNPNLPIGPHSPPMAWQYPPVIQNQTASSEDRNDSGINSASDCHSSSPGSENGAERFRSPENKGTQQSQVAYYSTPIYQRGAALHNSNGVMLPRTSMYPASPVQSADVFVKTEPRDFDEKEGDSTLVGASFSQEAQGEDDALKRLEMSVERVNFPSSSPGISENSMDDDRRSDNAAEDEDSLHVPRMNSHGKIKTFKCKQCAFVAVTKASFWEHQRQHIKPEKLLTCLVCPFVTEYKHHLEYHIRNHEGSKPYKCSQCDYSCVNKSMLNSHYKSHTNIYQYRCKDCTYVTKYCHSLKIHLRKYKHAPAMVLNPDGSPNPHPIIDVYGTRRGPKMKPIGQDEGPNTKKPKTENAAVPSLPFQQLMAQAPPMLAYSLLQQAMIYQNMERLAREGLYPQNEEPSRIVEEATDVTEPIDASGALDLTKGRGFRGENQADQVPKLDTPSTSSDEDDGEDSTTIFENVEVVQNQPPSVEVDERKVEADENRSYDCQYCSISFGDAVLYTMHMGYHGYKDPFACNMCGEKCNDKVTFFLHIARTSHS